MNERVALLLPAAVPESQAAWAGYIKTSQVRWDLFLRHQIGSASTCCSLVCLEHPNKT